MRRLILTFFTITGLAAPAVGQRTFQHMTDEEKMVWQCDHRVFYEIFVRSFYDSNGDGIGDLKGITLKLDYLADLGIGGLWLTPFHPSPSYHKYDVTNYFDVDPQYGTLDDFRELVAGAHRRGMYVLMDLVVNHTSQKHPWFYSAIKKDPQYYGYYSWSAAPPETKHGSWHTPRDENGKLIEGEKYYAFFSRTMPDLNLDNPMVRAEVIRIGRWWIEETGVDGFRLDAAQHIYDFEHPQKNVEWWKEFTDSLKKTKPDVITIGECWSRSDLVAQYLPALTGVFNFELSWAILKSLQDEQNEDLAHLSTSIRSAYDKNAKHYIDPIFLSNHDNNRILSDLKNNEAKARLAACIYLTLPGTPFIYYGEEIGMKGMKPDSLIREPFIWGEQRKQKKKMQQQGQTRWEKPQYSTAQTVSSMAVQAADTGSILNLYKALIRFRRMNAALTSRTIFPVTISDSSVVAYRREGNGQELLVLHNLSHQEKVLTLPAELAAYSRLRFRSVKSSTLFGSSVKLSPYGTLIAERK
jgi:glycosidase